MYKGSMRAAAALAERQVLRFRYTFRRVRFVLNAREPALSRRIGSRLFLVAFLGAIAGNEATSLGSDAPPKDVLVEDVIAAANSVAERIDVIDEVYTLRQENVDQEQPEANAIESITMRMIVDLREQRYHYWHDVRASRNRREPRTAEFAFDQGLYTRMDPQLGQGVIASLAKPHEDILRKERLLVGAFMNRAKPSGNGLDDGSLASLLRHAVAHGHDEIDGRECVVLDINLVKPNGDKARVATVWIDQPGGMLPLRYVEYGHDGGQRVDQRILSVADFSDGRGGKISLPIKMETLTSVRGRNYKVVLDVDPKKTRVNPSITETTFRVQFPPGALIQDQDANRTFFTPGGKPRGGGGAPTDEADPSLRRSRLLVGTGGLAILAATLYFLRMRNGRNLDKQRVQDKQR